jgi:acyl-CoA hydrolase
MDVLCKVEDKYGEPMVESHFIMVARCPETKKAAPVIQLNPTSQQEIKNFEKSKALAEVSERLLNFIITIK